MHRVALNLAAPRFGGFGGGPVALKPGDYTVRLTVDGQTHTQPAVVAPDPRGATSDNASEGTATDD